MIKAYRTILIAIFQFLNTVIVFGQVAPGDPNAVPVRFRFNHHLTEANGVGINGDMNAWVNGVFVMHEIEPDLWVRVMDLLPRTYEYKFVRYIDTVGQHDLSYYSDPLNPAIGGPFNNSYLDVKDPMIYYLLPKDGSTFKESPTVIMADIAVARKSQLDVNKIYFSIDGIEIPNASSYYNPQTKQFSYNLPQPLDNTKHNVLLRVYNTAGDSAELTTNFTIASGISTAFHTFIFDSKSPGFNFLSPINKVDVKGTFNFEGLDAMKDSNGIYTVTKEIFVDKPEEYTFIINGGLYINDPDNPELSKKHRTQIVKKLNPRSQFNNFNPPSGAIFTNPVSTLQVNAHISPSDSGYAINSSGIVGKYDGSILRFTKTESGAGYDVKASINNPSPGRHVIEFNGRDVKGVNSWVSYYTFGTYPPGSGYYHVDGENDDNGSGTYNYPPNIPVGSADIRELNITLNDSQDSLIFAIQMEKINAYTRIGFQIVNSLNKQYVNAPDDVELRIPEWHERGVFFILSNPSSPYLNSSVENILYTSREPLVTTSAISLSANAISANQFRFGIAIAELEDVMGSYNNKWYYCLYSYLKDNKGTVEVGTTEGGYAYSEDTDVYDAGFFSDPRIQARLLANFRSSGENGGAQIALIGSEERGAGGILPEQINSAFGIAPEIKLYANGGNLLQRTVKLRGYADVSTGTSVKIINNGSEYQTVTNSQKEFETDINLQEGQNIIHAAVNYSGNLTSSSKPVIYNYIVDHKPVAKIYSTLSQSSATLYADSSYDPDGAALTYIWIQDKSNPKQVSLSSSGSSVSFNVPSTEGEYYFTLKAADAANDTAWARTVVVVSDSGVYLPDMSIWHPKWVDSAIVYSIFVRTFDASGTINGVTERLPQLKELGINCIWFLPIHPTTGNLGPDNPGYAITDYFSILSNYGTKADFKKLVQKAHSLGIRVILDHVIQHTSVLHPFMLDANKFKNNSPYYDFYMWNASNIFQYLFTWVDLPSINYDSKDTRDYLIRMAKYWIQDFEIDGYRCDVAWAIDSLRQAGPAFWQRWRSELKSMKPDLLLLAETDAWQTKIFNKKFDAAYDWKWFGSIRSVIAGTQSINQLNSWVKSYESPAFPDFGIPFKFIESQDDQRFIEAYGIANTKTAAAHLLTAPGLPHIYAGQEVGEVTNRGNIDWSDPHQLRPYYKKLINIRKNNPAVAYGDFTRVNNTAQDKVYSYLRTHNTNNVIVNVNFSSQPVSTIISVPMNKISFDSTAAFYLADYLNGDSPLVIGTDLKEYPVTIPANSAQVFVLQSDPLTNVEAEESIPEVYNLAQNYPNPFNPSTTIVYSLPFESRIKINIYDVLGQRVAELVNDIKPAGRHNIVWNASDMASGIYLYSIESEAVNGVKSFRHTKKMLLIK